jgi:hypothetical protein
MRSLKKTSYFTFIGVASLLLFVIILGFRQYQLSERYNSIITLNEKMIFQFSTIREQITTSLIKNDWQKTANTSEQLNNLNSSVARLQENILIPGEYRLDMAKQLDLTGLAITLKELPSNSDKLAGSLILQNKLRSLAEYLLQFDRIIVSQMRSKLIQFQTIMIGALAGVICLISFSLLRLYKNTMTPLLHLAEQTEQADTLINGLQYSRNTSLEISHFIDSVNDLILRNVTNDESEPNSDQLRDELSGIINECTNLSNGIINYAQLLKDSYREVGIGEEEKNILQNIIDAAERIALLNKEI